VGWHADAFVRDLARGCAMIAHGGRLPREVAMDTRINVIVDSKGGAIEFVGPDTAVYDAVALMNRQQIGSVLVLDGARLLGIFTERDVLTRVVGAGRDPLTTKVADVMTRKLVVIERTTTVGQALGLMSQRRCRHLPVVDGDRVVGLVSMGDLTRWIIRDQERAIVDLTDYIHRST
jgi:CBS domain-containing protein